MGLWFLFHHLLAVISSLTLLCMYRLALKIKNKIQNVKNDPLYSSKGIPKYCHSASLHPFHLLKPSLCLTMLSFLFERAKIISYHILHRVCKNYGFDLIAVPSVVIFPRCEHAFNNWDWKVFSLHCVSCVIFAILSFWLNICETTEALGRFFNHNIQKINTFLTFLDVMS